MALHGLERRLLGTPSQNISFCAFKWEHRTLHPIIFSNVIRALGQPFTIVPLSALATSLLLTKDAKIKPGFRAAKVRFLFPFKTL